MTTSIIRFPAIVLAVLFAGLASGATPAVNMKMTTSGPHANEEFCKTIIRGAELFGQYMKDQQPLNPDMTKRAKFFADSKALNAIQVKTAPASLASDVARAIKNSNAMIDAQLAGDRAKETAAVAALTSPEHLAAGKRMSDYCGVKF